MRRRPWSIPRRPGGRYRRQDDRSRSWRTRSSPAGSPPRATPPRAAAAPRSGGDTSIQRLVLLQLARKSPRAGSSCVRRRGSPSPRRGVPRNGGVGAPRRERKAPRPDRCRGRRLAARVVAVRCTGARSASSRSRSVSFPPEELVNPFGASCRPFGAGAVELPGVEKGLDQRAAPVRCRAAR